MKPRIPAASEGCGCATSASQPRRRTALHAPHLRPLRLAAIPGTSPLGNRGRKAHPHEVRPPSDPVPRGHVPNAEPEPVKGPLAHAGRQQAHREVRRPAGPFPRGHVPNADWGLTRSPAVSVGNRNSRARVHGLRARRCVSDQLPRTLFVRGSVPPIRPALPALVPNRSHEWCRGARNRGASEPSARRRSDSGRQPELAAPEGGQRPGPVEHALTPSRSHASDRATRSTKRSARVSPRTSGSGPLLGPGTWETMSGPHGQSGLPGQTPCPGAPRQR